jgi:tetratricopeptide (TPR) repeat protein
MPEDQKIATQIFALTNVADICFHFSMNDCSSNAVAGLQTLLTTSGSNSNDPDFERRQKATAMYWQGKLAARTAEYETARKKAEEFKRLLEPDNNPRKLERYHELLGLTALLAKEYDKSIDHYRQSNLSLSAGDVKNSYMLARALQATGQNEEAAERLGKVANWNFNSVWFAMLRKNALQEASLASSGAE